MDPGDDKDDWWERPRPRRRALPVVALAVVLLAAGGVGTWFVLSQPATKGSARTLAGASASAIEEPATLEPLAFAPRAPVADEIFAKRMMAFAIALDHTRGDADAGLESDLGRAHAALRSDDVKAALGERAAQALEALAKTAIEAAQASLDDEAKVDELEIASARLDNALIAARLPYFVDASVIVDRIRARRLVLLYEFAIASSSLHVSDGKRVRAVRLRRLDKLNWSHTLLGFVKPRRLQAVVLLDQIDEQLVNHVLPALADGAGMPLLLPEGTTVSKEAAGISERAGAQTREEVAALPGVDLAAVKALGESLRARRALFEKWDAKLKASGGSVRLPSGLAIDLAIVNRDLKGIADPADLTELGKLQARLTAPDVTQTYELIRNAYADSVERHEVQHRLDHMTPIPLPKALDAFVGPDQGPASDAARSRIQSELSAYVAELAREDRLARTTFTLITRFLVDPRLRGAAESYSAAIAIEEIARELGVSGIAPLVHDGGVDEARLVRAHEGITAAGSQRLAGAARNVWKRIFGRDLAPLERL